MKLFLEAVRLEVMVSVAEWIIQERLKNRSPTIADVAKQFNITEERVEGILKEFQEFAEEYDGKGNEQRRIDIVGTRLGTR